MSRAIEMYYSVSSVSLLVELHPKTVVEKMKLGEFGQGVVNVGGEQRPDYRIPASGINGWLESRRVFAEQPVVARSVGELRRKVVAA